MHILNLSFDTGTVPNQWLNAIVTSVPKVAKPASIADYRHISVTPLLSRLTEKLEVRRSFTQQFHQVCLMISLAFAQLVVLHVF